VAFSYAAHFAEVRVEPTTCRIRVPRVVSVADCGRVANPVTVASQVRGGVIWGIGATIHEQSVVDARYGGFLNSNLEGYSIAVSADTHQSVTLSSTPPAHAFAGYRSTSKTFSPACDRPTQAHSH
jgi:xanthine dehydrogenase YagR molybdenum-binding subunit